MKVPHVIHRALAGDLAYLRFLAWQHWHHVDYTACSVADLGLPASEAHDHMHSGGPDLLRVLDTVPISATDRCIDLGSGKGASTFTLAERFTSVVGIELSPELVRIAEQNQTRLHHRRVQFLVGNALTFSDYDTFSHVYLFNSFPAVVVEAVVAHLADSLRRQPRPLTVIYKYPGTPTVEFPGFDHSVVHPARSHPFHLYCTNGCG